MNNEPRPAGPDQQAESADKRFQQYLQTVTESLLQADFSEAEVIEQYQTERERFTAGGEYRTDIQPVSDLHQRLQTAVELGWSAVVIQSALSAEIDRLSHQIERS